MYDQNNQETVSTLIGDIILCMETGVIVILVNLEFIYQTFYDVLNLSYTNIGGKKFSRVAFGSETQRIEVNPLFKFVLIANKQEVSHFDLPLLSRFEKHFFNFQLF